MVLTVTGLVAVWVRVSPPLARARLPSVRGAVPLTVRLSLLPPNVTALVRLMALIPVVLSVDDAAALTDTALARVLAAVAAASSCKVPPLSTTAALPRAGLVGSAEPSRMPLVLTVNVLVLSMTFAVVPCW